MFVCKISIRRVLFAGIALAFLNAARPLLRAAETAANDLPFPLIERFENFGMKDGIPTHKVHCVLRASDDNFGWALTTARWCARMGKFRRVRVEDGLQPQDGTVPGGGQRPRSDPVDRHHAPD